MRRGDVMKRRGRGQIDTRRRIGQGRRGERRTRRREGTCNTCS